MHLLEKDLSISLPVAFSLPTDVVTEQDEQIEIAMVVMSKPKVTKCDRRLLAKRVSVYDDMI